MLRIALMATLFLAGCATQPEVTVLVGPRRMNSGDTDVAVSVLLIQRVGEHGVGGCLHTSEPQNGEPFNNDEEQTSDSCGLGARWGGNPK